MTKMIISKFSKFSKSKLTLKFKQQISLFLFLHWMQRKYMVTTVFLKLGIFTVTQALVHHRIPAWQQYVS